MEVKSHGIAVPQKFTSANTSDTLLVNQWCHRQTFGTCANCWRVAPPVGLVPSRQLLCACARELRVSVGVGCALSACQKVPTKRQLRNKLRVAWVSGWWTPTKRSLSWCWHFGERTPPPNSRTRFGVDKSHQRVSQGGACVCRETHPHTQHKSSREWVWGQLRACGSGQHI